MSFSFDYAFGVWGTARMLMWLNKVSWGKWQEVNPRTCRDQVM